MSKQKQRDHMEDDGSYVVQKNRKLNIFAFILCLLVALIIWVYATNMEDKERAEEETESSTAAAVFDDAFLSAL